MSADDLASALDEAQDQDVFVRTVFEGPLPPTQEMVVLHARALVTEAATGVPAAQPKSPIPARTYDFDGAEVRLARSTNPVMDRWDNHITAATVDDPELFSYVKAFMYVESAGRQYAVSHTGCSGLMQFCAGTAKSQPFRDVFGRGEVYVCGCRGSQCRVSRSVQVELESGDPTRVQAQEDAFPCEMTDARFDPDRAIPAGALYVQRLHDDYNGNIYLMYIGYNSGPAIADRVLDALDGDTSADLGEIQLHLADALRPYYGAGSNARARGLTRVHLPKLQRALVRYGGPSKAEMLGTSPAVAQIDLNPQIARELMLSSPWQTE